MASTRPAIGGRMSITASSEEYHCVDTSRRFTITGGHKGYVLTRLGTD
jgi:hypothetical protein